MVITVYGPSSAGANAGELEKESYLITQHLDHKKLLQRVETLQSIGIASPGNKHPHLLEYEKNGEQYKVSLVLQPEQFGIHIVQIQAINQAEQIVSDHQITIGWPYDMQHIEAYARDMYSFDTGEKSLLEASDWITIIDNYV